MANEGQREAGEASQPESDWQDPTTVQGLVGGLVSSGLNVLTFLGLAAVVAILTEFTATKAPIGAVYTLFEAAVLLLSILLGGGIVYVFRESFRANQYLESSRGRLTMMAVFYRRNRPSASGLDPEGEGRTLG